MCWPAAQAAPAVNSVVAIKAAIKVFLLFTIVVSLG
jgi:hypothetical protein